MRIFEVKNNLIKLFFEKNEKLFLAGFLMIKDSRETYIAQIMHMETNKHGNIAIARLIYNVTPDGNLVNFEGTVPSNNSVIGLLNLSEIVKLLEGENSVQIGELAQDNIPLKLDFNFIKNKLLILSENQDNSDIMIRKLNDLTKTFNKRTVIIDTVGTYGNTNGTLVAGKNFKLPVNYETLGFISEKGIEYKTVESKAVIQETFLELQYYVKTIESQYIPVNSLIDILEAQYKSSKMVELVLIKNALLKYQEKGVLANSKKDFLNLNKSLIENSTTLIDLSNIDEEVQREYISFIYNKISKMNEEVIVFVTINNKNSDKKLLKQMYFTKNINTVTVLSYEYKYLNELKKISKNMIMFTPTIIQDDFDAYNTFLSKLAKWEYIAYGQETQYLPLIVSLKTDKGIFNDKIKPNDNVETATSAFFKDKMKELVEKQYQDVIHKEQETQIRNRIKEKRQMDNEVMMQNQMHQLSQKQAMELPYTIPQYNYSPAYMNQMTMAQPMGAPYYYQQQMPMQMPYPMMMPQNMVPQQYMQMMPPQPQQFQQVYPNQIYNQQPLQPQNQNIEKIEELDNFDSEQLDKLYANSPVENAFNNIKINLKQNNQKQETQELQQNTLSQENSLKKNEQIPQINKVPQQEKNEENTQIVIKPQEEEIKVSEQNSQQELPIQNQQEIINIQSQNSEELTEADLDMISEIDVELHEEEQLNNKQEDSEPIIPKYIDDTPDEPKLPVFSQPELQSPKNIDFKKNDRVRHTKFGEGVVEKVINYGSKKLCSIYFEKVGRRLLEPHISELEKL